MANPYSMPSIQAPMVDDKGRITQVWAGLLRDYMIGLKAERAPGRVEMFYLSAADVADVTKFVQAGATAGLGVGDYLGWAICNGNNGTPAPGATFPRFSVTAAGTTGGSDSSAHTHAPGTYHATIIDDGTDKCSLRGEASADWTATKKFDATTLAADATVRNYGVPLVGASGAASATDNRPAFFSWVPLMRV